ncbi:MAG: hypothetical protein PHN75_14850, partial [Syntrophales bacterium]|nr:hypothetical protein [Syntrophales bacterium]
GELLSDLEALSHLSGGRIRISRISDQPPGTRIAPPLRNSTGHCEPALRLRDKLNSLEIATAPDDRLAMTGRVSSVTDTDMQRRLQSLATAGETLTCRTFSAVINRTERIASFSYLIAGSHAGSMTHPEAYMDLPDHDAMPVNDAFTSADSLSGMFAFPRGARAGTLLHDILEHLDFRDVDGRSCEKIVETSLAKHGFEPSWRHTLCEMIAKVIYIPLDPAVPGLTLAAISKEERISELEFYYPLKSVTPDALKALFSKEAITMPADLPDRIGRLTFQPAKGLLKGFIDLIFRFNNRFYLLDWKSNFLGYSIEDYANEALGNVMQDELYTLQYHLYTLALHQYLRARIPDYDYDLHFGGVFYIFLRGVDPSWGPGFGIFRDRPDKTMIEMLKDGLIGGGDAD